jgi:hypothetical protein
VVDNEPGTENMDQERREIKGGAGAEENGSVQKTTIP